VSKIMELEKKAKVDALEYVPWKEITLGEGLQNGTELAREPLQSPRPEVPGEACSLEELRKRL